MKIKKELYNIKNIIILRNVNWCGKWLSKYSLFELIFDKFVLEFIKDVDLNVKILIKQKDNEFLKRLRKENYYLLEKDEIFILEQNIYLKSLLEGKNIQYFLKFNIFLNTNIKIDFVFVCDNIIFFSLNNNFYISNNIISDLNNINDEILLNSLNNILKIL